MGQCTAAPATPNTQIKIHGVPMSQNAVGPIVLAMELKIGDMEFCDLMKGAHKEPSYLKIHPYGQIPALQDGAFCLGESNAILRYLALAYAKNLYPVSSPKVCAKIDFAMETFSNVYQAHMPVVYVVFGFAQASSDQGAANKAYTEAIQMWLNTHLTGKFVTGDTPSIADYKAVPFFFAAMQPVCKKKLGFVPPPRMVKYCEDFMAAVPAAKFMREAGGFSIKEFAASKE